MLLGTVLGSPGPVSTPKPKAPLATKQYKLPRKLYHVGGCSNKLHAQAGEAWSKPATGSKFAIGETATLSCLKVGWFPTTTVHGQGAATVQCLADGTWSSTAVYCMPHTATSGGNASKVLGPVHSIDHGVFSAPTPAKLTSSLEIQQQSPALLEVPGRALQSEIPECRYENDNECDAGIHCPWGTDAADCAGEAMRSIITRGGCRCRPRWVAMSCPAKPYNFCGCVPIQIVFTHCYLHQPNFPPGNCRRAG